MDETGNRPVALGNALRERRGTTASATVDRARDRRKATLLLKRLSRRERKVLLLRVVERRSTEEVAEKLAMPAERVRWIQYHALTRLRALAKDATPDSRSAAGSSRRQPSSLHGEAGMTAPGSNGEHRAGAARGVETCGWRQVGP